MKGGLANGMTGFVRAIIFNEEKTSSDSPDFIMVQFDNYSGPCINGNLFPVAMIIRSCEKNGRKFIRKQFPLKVAYAIAIHKSQGLTLELIVIDLGDIQFAAGLTYVVLSRVKRLIDLVLIFYPDKKQFVKIRKSKPAQLKILFLENLRQKALGKVFNYHFHTYVSVYIHCIKTKPFIYVQNQ